MAQKCYNFLSSRSVQYVSFSPLFKINFSIYLLQVVIEGVAGVTFSSNIAVDDLDFSTNLTCVSVGKPTPPETFEGIVFRTGGYFHTCTLGSRYALY